MRQILLGQLNNQTPLNVPLAILNRHGLIAGSTGTGKTVTIQRLMQELARQGTCVFAADIKGDLAGLANDEQTGDLVVFWDLLGKQGHPMRSSISEMGPLLLGRLLELNDTQQGVLNIAFKVADDEGLLLLDLKDLKALLEWLNEHRDEIKASYGNVTTSTIGAIQRGLLTLDQAGATQFFQEPSFKIENLTQRHANQQGLIHILDATKIVQDARLYSTYLLWLLSELFESLPEVGDLEQPKLVFFFDEAHLLFNAAPKVLLEKIEQLVRLIRSKGVGVFFITQNPLDIPESVLAQLGNRVQHALRAFTPKDQKVIKTLAQTFRANPNLNTQEVITQLGVGEALVSFLDTQGVPNVVERVKIQLPTCRLGAITEAVRQQHCQQSPFQGMYDTVIDRESAYEKLNKKVQSQFKLAQPEYQPQSAPKPSPEPKEPKRAPGRPRQTVTETVVKATARSLGSSLGRQIVRGLMGSIFKR